MKKQGKLIVTTLLLIFVFTPVFSQKDLGTLLDERDTLYAKQAHLESKNSTFWGTKSKKDLRRMVENLEEILVKDNEIIMAVKRENFTSRTNIIYKNRDTRQEKSRLQSEVTRYKRLNTQKAEELQSVLAQLDRARSIKTNYELIILVFFITIIGLIFYNRRLSARLK